MHLCFFETSSEWAFGSKSYRIIPLICRCIFLWDLLFCCDLWYCQSQTSWRYQNLVRGDELQSQPPKMVSRGFLHHCCKTKGHVCWKLGCMNAEAIITLITWFSTGGLTLRHAELHLLGSLTDVSLASTSDLLQIKHHPIRAAVSPFASPGTLLSLLV